MFASIEPAQRARLRHLLETTELKTSHQKTMFRRQHALAHVVDVLQRVLGGLERHEAAQLDEILPHEPHRPRRWCGRCRWGGRVRHRRPNQSPKNIPALIY